MRVDDADAPRLDSHSQSRSRSGQIQQITNWKLLPSAEAQSSDRGFYKARNELISAQKERRKSETGFDSQDLAKPAETPLESSAPPDPPHETTAEPGLSIPAPPDPLDCETLDEAFEVLMKGPDGEMAKRMIDEWKIRRKVA